MMTPEQFRQTVEQVVRAVLASRGESCDCPVPSPSVSSTCPCGKAQCPCGPDCQCAKQPQIAAAPAGPILQKTIFLFTGAERGIRDGREWLSIIRKQADCEVVASGGYLARHGDKWLREDAAGLPVHTCLSPDEVAAMLRRASVLAIPHPTRTLIAKAVRGIEDSLSPILLIGALMAGVPVVISRGDAEPADWPATTPVRMRSGPGSLGVEMLEGLRTLENWGAEVKRGGEFIGAVEQHARAGHGKETRPAVAASMMASAPPGQKRFYTAGDVRLMAANGRRELVLGPGDRVTDEAIEVARDVGVKIERG